MSEPDSIIRDNVAPAPGVCRPRNKIIIVGTAVACVAIVWLIVNLSVDEKKDGDGLVNVRTGSSSSPSFTFKRVAVPPDGVYMDKVETLVLEELDGIVGNFTLAGDVELDFAVDYVRTVDTANTAETTITLEPYRIFMNATSMTEYAAGSTVVTCYPQEIDDENLDLGSEICSEVLMDGGVSQQVVFTVDSITGKVKDDPTTSQGGTIFNPDSFLTTRLHDNPVLDATRILSLLPEGKKSPGESWTSEFDIEGLAKYKGTSRFTRVVNCGDAKCGQIVSNGGMEFEDLDALVKSFGGGSAQVGDISGMAVEEASALLTMHWNNEFGAAYSTFTMRLTFVATDDEGEPFEIPVHERIVTTTTKES